MLKGSCLCGGVRYEIDGEVGPMAQCYCSMCRKHHGAGFVTWFAVPRDQFEWVAGDDRLVRRASSDHGTRSFCGDCGSPLFYESTRRPDTIDIALASMDAPIDRAPQMHAYFSDRASWVHVEDSLPRFGGATGLEPLDPAGG